MMSGTGSRLPLMAVLWVMYTLTVHSEDLAGDQVAVQGSPLQIPRRKASLPWWNAREPFQYSSRCYCQVERPYPWRFDGEVGPRARFGVVAVRLPRASSRTRRARLGAPGAPRVFPAGQPVLAAAGAGVQGVGMLLPR
jgi:hypothetical protein